MTAAASRAAALLDRSADALAASSSRRFMVEAGAGSVSHDTYARYLAIEEGFVRTATRVAGLCVWSAPDWSTARRHAEAVADLVGPQTDYFARLRQAFVADAVTLPAVLARASALSEHVNATVERFGYAAAVVGLFAAESLYLGWCSAALEIAATRPAALQEWLDLHATEPFRNQVAFLAETVDRLGAEISDAQLDTWFLGMLAAEDAFHDSVYLEPLEPGLQPLEPQGDGA